MNVPCNNCGKNLSVSVELYGRQGRCPICQTIMTFPNPQQRETGSQGQITPPPLPNRERGEVGTGASQQLASGNRSTSPPVPRHPANRSNGAQKSPLEQTTIADLEETATATADLKTCRICTRSNPPIANYCYYDGSSLSADSREGPVRAGNMAFPAPFFFSSKTMCANFNELAFACHSNWDEALRHLAEGNWQTFFGNIGRLDLSLAAKDAAQNPNADQGLSQLLERFPAEPDFLRPASLKVQPPEENLGQLQPGTNRTFEVTLVNQGMLLLQGFLWSDCEWLALGDNINASQKVFQTRDFYTLSVRVLGDKLRAGRVPLKGEIIVETNGGKAVVPVTVEVPVQPFPGVPEVANNSLSGSRSPRVLAVQAKENLKDAAVLFEAGAVRLWYEVNGWTYPVAGASASGKAAIQQFFEALGLTKPPLLQLKNQAITCQGMMGQRISTSLTVLADESKPIFAHGWSDQPWVEVGPFLRIDREIRILVEVLVPPCPGEVRHAQIQIRGNGNQVFTVPVTVAVGAEDFC
ncbi:MAG: hypothetical protein ACFCD0_11085 [Gemmataceae bacterium]